MLTQPLALLLRLLSTAWLPSAKQLLNFVCHFHGTSSLLCSSLWSCLRVSQHQVVAKKSEKSLSPVGQQQILGPVAPPLHPRVSSQRQHRLWSTLTSCHHWMQLHQLVFHISLPHSGAAQVSLSCESLQSSPPLSASNCCRNHCGPCSPVITLIFLVIFCHNNVLLPTAICGSFFF